MRFSQICFLSFLFIFSLVLLPSVGVAQKVSKDEQRLMTAVERTKKATAVLKAVAALPADKGIPKEITDKMNLIGVLPDAGEFSLLISKAFAGSGVTSAKQNGAWSTPAFYVLSQGFGFDLTGVSYKKFDVIMAVVNADLRSKEQKKKDKKLPPADKPEKPKPYFYIFADGILKPVAVKIGFFAVMFGAQTFVVYDDKFNKTVYGLKGDDVLLGKTDPAKQIQPDITAFNSALNELYPAK